MKWRLLTAMLSITTVTAFAGAISGTLAWYEYSTRAALSYEGTSVFNTEQLQIGLKTSYDVKLVDRLVFESNTHGTNTSSIQSYILKVDETSAFSEIVDVDENSDGVFDTTYWFVRPGQALKPEVIANYLGKTNSNYDPILGSNVLCPVTSKAHGLDDEITTLYKNPYAGENSFPLATGYEYSKVSFAFRVLSTSNSSFLPNQDVWLKDAYCKANNDTSDAIRLYMEGDRKTSTGREETHTLFNPSSDEDSFDVVAGLLDLNKDGYYDYTGSLFDKNKRTELIYGIDNQTIDSSLLHRFTSNDYENVNSWEYNNINQYEDIDENSEFNTFYARHDIGTSGFVDYTGLDLPKAYYSGKNSIYPIDDHGILSGGKILTSTSNDDLAIASLDMTIFLEGWNHSVIDQTIGYYYNLGLTFQINKVE